MENLQLNSIKDEYSKITVVLHIAELMQKFDIRIEVSKNNICGSRFEIVHN